MKLRSTKFKILILLVIAIIAISTLSTVAYFTAEDTAKNVITAGNLRIEILEKMISDDGDALVPFEDRVDVMPGCEISKIVYIKNAGGQEAYIRLSVENAISLAKGVDAEADSSLITYDINKEYWTLKDGFYYYNKPLASGEVSEPIFTSVSFSGNMGNEYQSSEARIKIDAYAVQVKNNGSMALEASGWSEQG